MGEPRGFLEIERCEQPERPPRERTADHADIHGRLPTEELRRQGARCMDCGIPFCLDDCPLGNLIPDWNDLVHRDRWRQAIDQLHATNPFPELTGLICPAPCESACVLEINDDPVTIKQIELAIAERAWDEGWIVPRPPPRRTGRRVAVIGSGPAGMAVAAQLNQAGHEVTMYERDEAPGGLNRFGVPDQKLPKDVIDRRIALMEAEGVVVHCGIDVGVDVDPQELWDSTDALVIATGARAERELDVPGSDLRGVHPAMEYLYARNRAVAAGRTEQCPPPSAADRTVVVIGAGDTSADCMSNAIREGARSVVQLDTYPAPTGTRPREIAGWPRSPRRSPTHYALDEGGRRVSAVEVTALLGRDGHVCAVEGTEIEPPPSRRPIAGTQFSHDADLVLVAIGFAGPEPELLDALDIERNEQGRVRATRHATTTPGVFVAGDAQVGPSLTVTALNEGLRCARTVDHWLGSRTG
ncbi:MAG: glutamate synthase subunit beta [Actinomycetota bacterium]|nr:glutamate synthase subunit beta [Actinomycetota bacterium]